MTPEKQEIFTVTFVECSPEPDHIKSPCEHLSFSTSMYPGNLGIKENLLSGFFCTKDELYSISFLLCGKNDLSNPSSYYLKTKQTYYERGCGKFGEFATMLSTDGNPTEYGNHVQEISLGEDQVHIWCVTTTVNSEQSEHARRILSKEEILRLGRYYLKGNGSKFSQTRAWLRVILGQYLKIPPQEIEFHSNEYGKLFLKETHESNIFFSISHSGSLTLYAFCRGRNIGVDVELVRCLANPEKIVQAFFSEYEASCFAKIPYDDRNVAFFALCTLKEAYVKIRGAGLAMEIGNLGSIHANSTTCSQIIHLRHVVHDGTVLYVICVAIN